MSTSPNSTENSSSSPVVAITNNSGVDVEIFDVFDPNPEGQQGAYQYTKLAKVSNGQTAHIQTLRNASQLLAGYSGDMTLGGKSFYYEQFPVSSKGVSVLDTPPYAWAISADDYTGSQQAFQFVKFTSANPTSNINKVFFTALQQNDDGASVNQYFAGSASFAKATFEAWTQVVFWQTQSLSAWQGSYFLYNVPKSSEKIQLMAAVSIKSDKSGTAGSLYLPDDKGAIKPDSKKYGLKPSGTGTVVLADTGSSGLTLSLTPAWVTILTSTNPSADGYPVGGSLSGTFNNDNVAGTGQRLPQHWTTPVPLSIFIAGNASDQSADVPSPTSDSSKGDSPWYSLWWIWVVIGLSVGITVGSVITTKVFINYLRRQSRNRIVNDMPDPRYHRDQIFQQQEIITEDLYGLPLKKEIPNYEYKYIRGKVDLSEIIDNQKWALKMNDIHYVDNLLNTARLLKDGQYELQQILDITQITSELKEQVNTILNNFEDYNKNIQKFLEVRNDVNFENLKASINKVNQQLKKIVDPDKINIGFKYDVIQKLRQILEKGEGFSAKINNRFQNVSLKEINIPIVFNRLTSVSEILSTTEWINQEYVNLQKLQQRIPSNPILQQKTEALAKSCNDFKKRAQSFIQDESESNIQTLQKSMSNVEMDFNSLVSYQKEVSRDLKSKEIENYQQNLQNIKSISMRFLDQLQASKVFQHNQEDDIENRINTSNLDEKDDSSYSWEDSLYTKGIKSMD